MAIKDGVCEYCGQAVLEGNECKCELAEQEQSTLKKIAEANDNVKQLFVDDAEACGFKSLDTKVIDFLNKANELIANGKFIGINVTCYGGINCKIASGNKHAIKVTRTIKSTECIEGEE